MYVCVCVDAYTTKSPLLCLLRAHTDFPHPSSTSLNDTLAALREQKRQNNETISLTNQRLASVGQSSRQDTFTSREVSVVLDATKPGVVKLRLVYMVTKASWKPAYGTNMRSINALSALCVPCQSNVTSHPLGFCLQTFASTAMTPLWTLPTMAPSSRPQGRTGVTPRSFSPQRHPLSAVWHQCCPHVMSSSSPPTTTPRYVARAALARAAWLKPQQPPG